MSAFVLGATGFVGREVVRQLCVRGGAPFAHVRPDSPSLPAWRERFEELGATVDTTPWDVAAMAARLRELRPAQVYVLIGTTRAKAKADRVEGNIYEQIDVGLTRIAVEAARASEARPRIVYLSSVGADATARSPYLRARAKAEALVRESGLPWVIARPSFIVPAGRSKSGPLQFGPAGRSKSGPLQFGPAPAGRSKSGPLQFGGGRDEARPAERGVAMLGDGLLAVAGVLGGKQLRDRYRSTSPDVLASALIRLGEASEHDRIAEGAPLR